MTAQTTTFLKNTLLASGQASGAITPTRMQDIPDSFPPWDDPANASALGAPAILRGTVSTYNLSGLAMGAGKTTTVRQSNASALQSAINYAAINQKFFECVPGIYEINSSTGLTIPAGQNGFVWRGGNGATGGSFITQFYATSPGAPILTIGDTTGATESSGYDISGANLQYGIAQTGFTSSTALVLGQVDGTRIGNISVLNAFNGFPGYDGALMVAGTFSCMFYNMVIEGWQRHGLNFNTPGATGNHFDNIYMAHTGQTDTPAMSGSYIFFAIGVQDMHFSRLNCEWGSTNNVFSSFNDTTAGLTFDALHLEGILMSGASPTIFNLAGATILINSFDFTNPVIQSGNLTGTPVLVQDYSGDSSTFIINNLHIRTLDALWPAAGGTTRWNTPLTLFSATLGDDAPLFQINGCKHRDDTNQIPGNVVLDSHMPVASFKTANGFSRYTYGVMGSKVEKAIIPVSSTYTHFGQYEDATILVPAAITAFTITLSNVQSTTTTSNSGINQPTRTGNTVRVRRQTGTASGTLTITNGGVGGGNLTAPSTSGSDQWYMFNGTNWVLLNPVT